MDIGLEREIPDLDEYVPRNAGTQIVWELVLIDYSFLSYGFNGEYLRFVGEI